MATVFLNHHRIARAIEWYENAHITRLMTKLQNQLGVIYGKGKESHLKMLKLPLNGLKNLPPREVQKVNTILEKHMPKE